MSIRDRLVEVRARIERAALACGRDPACVRLVAVSKTRPAEAVREAYEAGQRLFGENYAQELDGKASALADLPDLEWHFIGHLQTNKAKLVAKHAQVVHSVDSVGLAHELAKRAMVASRGPLPVLIEVNVSGEAQKAGVAPDALETLVACVRALAELELRGLMTMPPAFDQETATRVFRRLAELRVRLGGVSALPELSMGMSDDLELAIAAGATLVRVGTAIFGER